jgi:hypothetical protein
MANKQINQLPDVTSGFSSDTLIPVQLPDGTTGRVLASQVQGGGSSTPGLYSVLDVDSYTNGYPIILNAGSKLKSSNTVGEDSLQMAEGYINTQSSDENGGTSVYLTPTEMGIRKSSNQTGTPLSSVIVGDNLVLQAQSIDNVYSSQFVYNNDGTSSEYLNALGSGNSHITKDTSLNDGNSASSVVDHYIKNETGEFRLTKTTEAGSEITEIITNEGTSTITQNPTLITSQAKTVILDSPDVNGTQTSFAIGDPFEDGNPVIIGRIATSDGLQTYVSQQEVDNSTRGFYNENLSSIQRIREVINANGSSWRIDGSSKNLTTNIDATIGLDLNALKGSDWGYDAQQDYGYDGGFQELRNRIQISKHFYEPDGDLFRIDDVHIKYNETLGNLINDEYKGINFGTPNGKLATYTHTLQWDATDLYGYSLTNLENKHEGGSSNEVSIIYNGDEQLSQSTQDATSIQFDVMHYDGRNSYLHIDQGQSSFQSNLTNQNDGLDLDPAENNLGTRLYSTRVDTGDISSFEVNPTRARIRVIGDNGDSNSIIDVTRNTINTTSSALTLETETTTIRDDDGTLLLQNPNQVTISSNIIQLSKVGATDLRLFIEGLSVHNNNSAALAAGLQVNEVYRKTSGELMIVH